MTIETKLKDVMNNQCIVVIYPVWHRIFCFERDFITTMIIVIPISVCGTDSQNTHYFSKSQN